MKHKTISMILLTILLGVFSLRAQGFEDFLKRIDSTPDSLNQAIADSFIATISDFPLIENNDVYFILTGYKNDKVYVAGDFNGWNYSNGETQKIAETDFHYLKKTFENDARLDYKYVINGLNWILDPRNPNKVTGGYGPNSELSMPGYVFPDEINYRNGIAHGSVISEQFHSDILNNNRNIWIYLPPGYDKEGPAQYPVVYVNDGEEYKTLGSMINVLDNLIADGKITPLVAIFVDPVNRDSEYRLNDNYLLMLISELVPKIDSTYNMSTLPQKRLIMGASLGGLISVYMTLKHPDYFALCGSHSGAFQVDNYRITDLYNDAEISSNNKYYLDWGTYFDTKDGGVQLTNILNSKEIAYKSNEWHEGHSWGNWRAHIDDILLYFFPSDNTGLNDAQKHLKPESFLLINYPNPFNPVTTIRFELVQAGRTSLTLYSVNGQKITTLLERILPSGGHRIKVDLSAYPDLASGAIFARVVSGGKEETIKMMLLK